MSQVRVYAPSAALLIQTSSDKETRSVVFERAHAGLALIAIFIKCSGLMSKGRGLITNGRYSYA